MRTTQELDQYGYSKYTFTSADPTSLSLALICVGAGLLLFGINGLRIRNFKAGGFEAGSGPTEQAESFIEGGGAPVDIPVATETSPEATSPPASVLKDKSGDAVEVYALADVPPSVMKDALANWPKETSKPTSFSGFEFATRKRGKGNHPWIVKFRDCPAVKVSYGGYAKDSATVATTSEPHVNGSA